MSRMATLWPGGIICSTRTSPSADLSVVRGNNGCLAMATASFGSSSTATAARSTGSVGALPSRLMPSPGRADCGNVVISILLVGAGGATDPRERLDTFAAHPKRNAACGLYAE
jgi:hypothetical protein